jgi:hypothetical protein
MSTLSTHKPNLTSMNIDEECVEKKSSSNFLVLMEDTLLNMWMNYYVDENDIIIHTSFEMN